MMVKKDFEPLSKNGHTIVANYCISMLNFKVTACIIDFLGRFILITLIGETFARESFASKKNREILWINFRE